MASFLIDDTSTVARTLAANDFGIVTSFGVLSTAAVNSMTLTGSGQIDLAINGEVHASTGIIDGTTDTLRLNIGANGLLSSTGGDGIRVLATSSFRVLNAGTILAGADGVSTDTNGNSSRAYLGNTGQIEGMRFGVSLHTTGFEARVINSGTISGHLYDGVVLNSLVGHTRGSVLYNSGTISGALNAFEGGEGADFVFNSGQMLGDVELDAGADRYESPGVTIGTVDGGAGNDSLAGGDTADTLLGGDDDDLLVGRGGDDFLDGQFGSDFLLGGGGNDSMFGGWDNDTLNGHAGDDTLNGGGSDDILIGQDGNDVLYGSDDNDILDGGNGDDILEGGLDNDILRGRAGEDELAGGRGRDFLTGGEGADIFVFRAIAETVVGANRDQILDFEQGVDLITVAGLSPGVFEFKGTAAFDTTVPNPELRLIETPTGSTIVQLDNNGDGVADAEIRVANVTGLTAEDFVL